MAGRRAGTRHPESKTSTLAAGVRYAELIGAQVKYVKGWGKLKGKGEIEIELEGGGKETVRDKNSLSLQASIKRTEDNHIEMAWARWPEEICMRRSSMSRAGESSKARGRLRSSSRVVARRQCVARTS